MFPQLVGEEAYYNDNHGVGGAGDYDQNDPPGSPDTFFFVHPPSPPSTQVQAQAQAASPAQAYAESHKQPHVQIDDEGQYQIRQPLSSDSTRTPPSPKTSSVQRRSIQRRPSQMNHTSPMFKRTSSSHAHSNHNATTAIKDNSNPSNENHHHRTQSLNALPQKALIHLLQVKEEETKRAKKLLRNALTQLELEVARGQVLEVRVRGLEERVESERVERERGGGIKTLKGVLDEQRERAGGGREVEGLKLKLSNTERELQRIKEDYRALQIEKDDSDRALVRARTLAREMKEKAILIQAREQGRQEGFEEGLRQGRITGQSNEESSGGEAGSGERVRTRKTRERPKTSRRHRSNTNPSLEAEAAIAAIRTMAESESLRIQLQLKSVERELDMERSKMKDVIREKGQLERTVREERDRRAERDRDRERERGKEKEAREEKEREIKEALQKEVEKERRERGKEKDRLEREKEKVKEQMENEKKEIEKKLTEAEANRLKDRQTFAKQLKKEKEKAAAAAATPLPYLAMAPPPTPNTTRVPRPPSSGSHQRPQTRPSSIDSYTSQASVIPFDMLQLPNARERRDLSVIPEDVSVRESGSNSVSPVPSWVTNPPIDYGKVQNDGGVPDLHWPQEPTNGSVPYNHSNNLPRRSSTGSYEIVIEPPSRPESVVGGGEPELNHTHNTHNTHNAHSSSNTDDPARNQFLSPHHHPTPLPQSQPAPRSESRQQYGTSTRPNSPLVGTINLGTGGLPPGFIPQSITDANGRSTPLNNAGGEGFIPPGSGGTHSPGRSNTPSSHWHNPAPHPPTGPAAIPIYGNPVTHERDRKRDDELGLPATTAHPPPPPPGTAGWSTPLHPPIFSTPSPQPFQVEPPKGGTWGGTPTALNNNQPLKPSFEYPPVIPGQTAALGSRGGGGSTWGTPRHQAASGFPGPGMTPRPRNQDLSPVIPTETLGGARSANSFPGPGMTPRPRNLDFSPVIPTQTLGSGGGAWGADGFPPGMTPRPRNQYLSPVIPTQTLGGSGGTWGTPNHHATIGFPGAGMTPRPRNQDLSPVIPTQTLGGGSAWNTPRHHTVSGFAAGTDGAGMTPGPRNQELPNGNQSSFSIYAPPSQGGGPRPSSPYPTRPYLNEEEDVADVATTVQNINALGSNAPPTGMGGKKGGKKGRKR